MSISLTGTARLPAWIAAGITTLLILVAAAPAAASVSDERQQAKAEGSTRPVPEALLDALAQEGQGAVSGPSWSAASGRKGVAQAAKHKKKKTKKKKRAAAPAPPAPLYLSDAEAYTYANEVAFRVYLEDYDATYYGVDSCYRQSSYAVECLDYVGGYDYYGAYECSWFQRVERSGYSGVLLSYRNLICY